MTITASKTAALGTFARFIWNSDLTECRFVLCGFDTVEQEDAALDALLSAKVDEGADCAGWDVDVAY